MSSGLTLVLLDADVFYPISLAKRVKREHSVYSKMCSQRHRPIKNTWLEKHYAGMMRRKGEPAVRYIDQVYDQMQFEGIPFKNVSEGERKRQRLTRRTRPSHRRDSNVIRIAQAANRRDNIVVIVSNTGHVQTLDPILHTDLGIRALSPERYVEEIC